MREKIEKTAGNYRTYSYHWKTAAAELLTMLLCNTEPHAFKLKKAILNTIGFKHVQHVRPNRDPTSQRMTDKQCDIFWPVGLFMALEQRVATFKSSLGAARHSLT